MNTFNRLFWLVVGTCAAAAGALGLGVTFDWWSSSTINSAIPFRDAWQEWRNIDWSQMGVRWLLLAAGIVVALIALMMAVRQLVPSGENDSRDDIVIEHGDRGRTVISRGSLARAAEAEARTANGVEDARVDHIETTPEGVRARYRLTVNGERDVPSTGTAVIDRGGRSLAQMLDRAEHRMKAQVAVRQTTHEREVR